MTEYADRDIIALDRAGNYYCRYISALTKEDLHSKSDIAAELAYRDWMLDVTQRKLDKANAEISRLSLAGQESIAIKDHPLRDEIASKIESGELVIS